MNVWVIECAIPFLGRAVGFKRTSTTDTLRSYGRPRRQQTDSENHDATEGCTNAEVVEPETDETGARLGWNKSQVAAR